MNNMSRYNKNLGDFGEDAAENYLRENKFEILERNFLVRGGEIDIIAMDGETLVFAEVKTRSSDKFGAPSEAVGRVKIAHMRRAAEEYIEKYQTDCEIRFDVIEVYARVCGTGVGIFKINHIRGIPIDE